MSGRARRSSAVVIGAGIAGLSAARVLADRFDQVTVLDRDRLPDTAEPRKGAPHGRHPHILLAAGQAALEEIFPGVLAELIDTGAERLDSGRDLLVYRFGTVWPRVANGVPMMTLTRPLLELVLRRRIAALANVSVRDGVSVRGLTGAADRVTGVEVDSAEVDSVEVDGGPAGAAGGGFGGGGFGGGRSGGGRSGGGDLPADLVVDCSGRGSRSDRWLAALGFPAPDVVEVKIGLGYTSRLLRRGPDDLEAGSSLLVLPTPPHEKRAGVALPIEGDRWLVGMSGWHGAHPTADEQAFVQHARDLPSPVIADLLHRAEPLSELVTHQFPASRRRRFERLRAVPVGYLTMGDALCSFNPVYGQGMTCAALQAVAVGAALDRRDDPAGGMARAFYRAAAGIITTPWRLAVGADFGWPQTTGPRPPAINLLNEYTRRLQLAALAREDVRATFYAVQHLIEPSSALFTPVMVARVLRGARRAAAA